MAQQPATVVKDTLIRRLCLDEEEVFWVFTEKGAF